MPVIKDSNGVLYSIPNEELKKFKVDSIPEGLLESGRDDDDIELQGPGSSASSTPYQWYAGD